MGSWRVRVAIATRGRRPRPIGRRPRDRKVTIVATVADPLLGSALTPQPF